MEIPTANTKNHKIDGTLIALKTRKKDHQTIGIIEFSKGKKAPNSKEVDDKVKLSHNAMQILNKLLETISCKRARVYTIQCVSKYHSIVENSWLCILFSTYIIIIFSLRWTNPYTIYGSTPSNSLPL